MIEKTLKLSFEGKIVASFKRSDTELVTKALNDNTQ